jgi:hypothetical protein
MKAHMCDCLSHLVPPRYLALSRSRQISHMLRNSRRPSLECQLGLEEMSLQKSSSVPRFLAKLLAAETETEQLMCRNKSLWVQIRDNKIQETHSMEPLTHRRVKLEVGLRTFFERAIVSLVSRESGWPLWMSF